MNSNEKYTAQQIADNGWIVPPSGSDNPITRYLYIIRLIHRGKLEAKKISREYEISGHEVERFLAETKPSGLQTH